MNAKELSIEGAWLFEPRSFPDSRGVFAAPFQSDVFRDALGFDLPLAQTNHSVSARGVIRGLHFADTPPGQAKYIYCPSGRLLDVIVDLRVGSPTFGRVEAVELDGESCAAVYIAEGLGHAFVALADVTVMTYLCTTPFNPGAEHGLSPLDPELALPWPADLPQVLSAKDRDAPSLGEALEQGILPQWGACQDWYAELRATST